MLLFAGAASMFCGVLTKRGTDGVRVWRGPTMAPLIWPEARIHTSRAARMAGKVSEIRVGGGLGELRTATTVPWAYAAGDSGRSTPCDPPARCRASARRRAAPPPRWGAFGIELAEIASSVAYRAAEASTSLPSRLSGPSIACTSVGSTGMWSNRASRAAVSFRAGSPSGAYRSSPHQKSTVRQSTVSRAGEAATAASTLVPIPPPVSTRCARPSAA